MTTCDYCGAEARYRLSTYRRRTWWQKLLRLPGTRLFRNACPMHRLDVAAGTVRPRKAQGVR